MSNRSNRKRGRPPRVRSPRRRRVRGGGLLDAIVLGGAALAFAASIGACNSILGNDPRDLYVAADGGADDGALAPEHGGGDAGTSDGSIAPTNDAGSDGDDGAADASSDFDAVTSNDGADSADANDGSACVPLQPSTYACESNGNSLTIDKPSQFCSVSPNQTFAYAVAMPTPCQCVYKCTCLLDSGAQVCPVGSFQSCDDTIGDVVVRCM
jgi:hypothetical protein